MACDIKEALTEEIALEGLDGITINTLWIRLSERRNFTFSLDDNSKKYLWNCILNLQGVEYYRLSNPRPDLVPYNRFHYLDPETRHFLETEHIPDDIYPIKIIDKEGVLGSCLDYDTRKDITEEIRTSRLSLSAVTEKYGNTLVIVASKTMRLRALIGDENDPDFPFDGISFCILERIGRARYNGEASFGKMSLQNFKQSSKTLYYMLKKLKHLKILKKQRLCVVRKPTNVKVTCFLYHLNRFYQVVGNRTHEELMNLALYLSSKPGCMEDTNRAKADLKLYDMFKKVTQHTSTSGDRSFEFFDVSWRERYPDAKPHEYLLKNHRTEKKVRMIRMTTTLEELEKSLKKDDNESDDEDDEAEVTGDSAKEVLHKRVFDEPNLYQTMKVISQTGSKGVSQISLQKTMGVSRLAARRVLKFLLRMDCITMVLEDRGRQKTIMYVDVENVKHNEAHQSVQEEMKKFNKLPDDSILSEEASEADSSKSSKNNKSNQSTKSGKGKARKELPLMSFVEEEPSVEKVTEIREELGRIDETKQHTSTSPMKLTPKQEILKEIQQESGVKVVVEEINPKEMTDKRTGKNIRGMKRFGCMLTESHVRRANWMLEVINAIKVVESFILLRLLRNREKEMNLNINMDHKSMKRLVDALTEEDRMRSFKAVITMGDRTREFTFLCAPNITTTDENLVRMIEEAKLRYFSVSREELRNRNLLRKAQAKANSESVTAANKKIDNIPQSALDSIRSHQEHKRKMAEKMPMMKYDRKAGLRFGLLPKMLRIRTTHEYLFYLSHDMHGQNVKTTPDQSSESTDAKNKTRKEALNEEGSGDDKLDVAEGMSEVIEDEPPVYSNEMSWRRYLPPVPVHSGYPKGWVLLSDVLLIMPVCIFCEVVNVCYNIEGLEELLKHPQKRFYPVINLPFKLTQQLLHSKKYVYSISTMCAHLAEMGLLSFGREVVKEKDQNFIYIHQNASLLDTKASLKGYNKTRAPEGHNFMLKTFHFDVLSDLQPYWEYLRLLACNSSLGFKSMVHADIEDDVTYEVKSLKQACAAYSTETVEDDGIIPGDQRGGAGLDSSIFCHAIKNWSYSGCQNPPRQYRKYSLSKGIKGGMDSESKKEEEDSLNKTLLKGKERLVLSDSSSKPVALKKVTRENVRGNKGGKGIPRRVRTELTKTHKIISRMEGKLLKKRCIKLKSSTKEEKSSKKKAYEKGDAKDQDIYRERRKLRVVWTTKEDSVLLMCRLATLIMDNQKKISLISFMKVRDYLHEKCGAISYDKTSQTVQRRVKFVLKNPQTETNFLLYYREAMQDEYVLKNYVSREFVLTDEDLVPNFRKLVDYLLDKFKSLDLQKCSLPDSLDDLRNNFTIQYIGKLTPHKMYSDVKNKAEICQDVLRNILHSAVLLQDKQGRTHEMFKLLSQYPDQLLSAVVKELRTDGLFVIQKKNYQRESLSQLQTGMGLRNFKVSQRYLYQYKHSYLSAMFDESATLWTQLRDRYLHGNDEDEVLMPFRPQSGECVMLIPLILNRVLDFKINMPQELVIVDMEGFYRFPWGRGKTGSSQTKGDKVLQDLKVAHSEKEKMLEKTALNEKDKTSGSHPEQEEKERQTSTDNDGKAGDKDVDAETDRSIDGNQAKDVSPGKDDGPSGRKESEVKDADQNSTENEKKNTGGKNTQDNYTSVKTNHTTIIIPNVDSVDEEVVDQVQGTGSVFASRTLLSLRRAEDCSFDDIRIFNAQDNFVVNSCEIGIKIRDKFEEGKAGNPIVTHFPVGLNEESPVDLNEESPISEMRNTKNDCDEKSKDDTGQENEDERAEKMEKISRMFCDKEKIKRLQKSLQKLLPFKVDMDDVWRRFSDQGVPEEDLKLYKNVFNIIDSYGDLGIRLIELKKQFDKGYPWREAVGVLMDHSAVLKVGVTSTRYVSIINARPWVIHAYRNIKGRGVPADENTENNIILDEINETDIQTPKANPLPYLYTDPDNKPSSEEERNFKKKRLHTEEELGDDSRTVTCEKRPLPEESKTEAEIESKRRRLNEKCAEVDDHAAVSNKDKTVNEINIDKTCNQDDCSGNLEVKTTTVSDIEDDRNMQNGPNKDDNNVPNNADKGNKAKETKTDNHDAEIEKKDKEKNNDNQESSANGFTKGDDATEDNTEEMKTRKLRKRKLTEVEKDVTEATAISTYDKVRLVIQPWRKPEGSINKPILKMMMESVMLYLMMKPGSPEDSLVHRYEPYLQPMILRNIVDILEDIGCVTRHYIRKRKPTLFSKPTLPEIGTEEEEDCVTLMVPTEDCVINLGLFGKEVFPNASWPDNTYPRSRPPPK